MDAGRFVHIIRRPICGLGAVVVVAPSDESGTVMFPNVMGQESHVTEGISGGLAHLADSQLDIVLFCVGGGLPRLRCKRVVLWDTDLVVQSSLLTEHRHM